MSNLNKAYDLDWDQATVEGYNESQNEALMVFNLDMTSEEKIARAIQYVVGRAIWVSHNFPPGANVVLSFDARGQNIDLSRLDKLKQTILELIENTGVDNQVSIEILS